MEPPELVARLGFSKSLDDADPRIKAAFPLVETAFFAAHGDEYGLLCDYTYRSPALQFELFKKGRKQDATGNWVLENRAERVTDKDGTLKKGEHNFYPSRAADIYITRDGKILWPLPKGSPGAEERAALYVALGKLWEAQGLVSGATWQYAWKDEPHVQVA